MNQSVLWFMRSLLFLKILVSGRALRYLKCHFQRSEFQDISHSVKAGLLLVRSGISLQILISFQIGVNDFFYNDNGNGFFIMIFSIKSDQDCTHRCKSWFFEGLGLFTQSWVPNFNPHLTIINFSLFRVFWHSLPSEY